MKAFQDFLRNNMNVYADECEIVNTATDENNFHWISKYMIRNSNDMYKVYRFPANYTNGLTSSLKITRTITQDYGYCLENGYIVMYLRSSCKTYDKTLIALLQCHDYALFVHLQVLNVGGNALLSLEKKCIEDGIYFTVQSNTDGDTHVHNLTGIFTKMFVGRIYVTDWYTSLSEMNIDARDSHSTNDVFTGEVITESIVYVGSDKTRHCTCIDIYLGTDTNYDLKRQHSENISKIKSEASHKGLDILMQASFASGV